jgi:hypothetical protein
MLPWPFAEGGGTKTPGHECAAGGPPPAAGTVSDRTGSEQGCAWWRSL